LEITNKEIMPAHKKNTLLQAATSNAETKACKRVFFSPPQKSTLPFFTNLFFPPHGFTANTTNCASNVNRFEQSVCNLDPTGLRTGRRASANKGLKEMAGEVVNQTFVHLINSCGRLTVCASKPPLL
jgi:hypothetical protein